MIDQEQESKPEGDDPQQDQRDLQEEDGAKKVEVVGAVQNDFSDSSIDDRYPPKPQVEQAKDAMVRTLFSLILFVYFYYNYVSKDWFFIGAIVLVLLIHELGHFIAMKAFGYLDVKMFFVPLLGAFVSGSKDQISQKQRAVILLAGPAPGIIIGIVMFYMYKGAFDPDMIRVSFLFMFINVINLLPILPLDGGRLVQTLFISGRGMILNVFTVLSACFVVYYAVTFESYFILILPLGLLLGMRLNAKLNDIRDVLDEDQVDYNKPYEHLSNKEYWLTRKRVVENFQMYQSVDPSKFEVCNIERRLIKQVKSLHINNPVSDMPMVLKVGIVAFWVGLIVAPFIITNILSLLNYS